MKTYFTKLYVTFMLMKFARQNSRRNRFREKFCFDDYGEDLDNTCVVKAAVDERGLKEAGHNYYSTDNKIQTDDYGIKEYVQQKSGYCEDDFSGIIYRKTPFKNRFIKTHFEC